MLSKYVPYVNATQQVNLGRFNLIVDSLTIGRGNNHSLIQNTALGFDVLKNTTTGNYNTGVGHQSLHNTTTGQYNTSVGQSSLFTNTTGSQNTAFGLNSLLYNTSGGSNVVIGLDAMQHNTTGSSNSAIGYNAGTHITGGATPNTTASNSVFIGRDSKALADNQDNQIVIGYNAIGRGSNTVSIGNISTTANYFTGSLNATSFVKSSGTSTQFLKADGSIDSSIYLKFSDTTTTIATKTNVAAKVNISDTAAMLSKYMEYVDSAAMLSKYLRIIDTSSFQRKNIGAYSFQANNTSAAANTTSNAFKDTSGVYSSTITWTGTTAPSGATSHTFSFTQVGKMVTLRINLVYATAGVALSQVALTLPPSCPTPLEPSGLGAANEILFGGYGYLLTTSTTQNSAFTRAFLRSNASDNGYEVLVAGTGGAYKLAYITINYFTN
jgi:hypothetical protein